MFKVADPEKFFTMCGALVAIILAVGSVTSILLYPEWSIKLNSFSDLGDYLSPSKWVFNLACMIAGIFLSIFSFGYIRFGQKISRIGGYAFFFVGIALFLVGFISKDFDHAFDVDLHMTFSEIFAFSFLVGASIVCVQNIIDREWKYFAPVAVCGVIVVITWLLYLNGEVVKYGEAQLVCFFMGFVWFACQTLRNKKYGFGAKSLNSGDGA